MIHHNRIAHSNHTDRSNQRRPIVDRAIEMLDDQNSVKHKVINLIEKHPGASMVAFAVAGGVFGWILSRKK